MHTVGLNTFERKGDSLFHNNPYMNTHFPTSPHIITYFPAYMIPSTPIAYDWLKQPYSLANSKPMVNFWSEKQDDYVAEQALPHYNYPNQTKVHYLNPEDYYSLS